MRRNLKSHLKLVGSLVTYPFRKRQLLKQQERDGYIVEIPTGSRGEYVVYREGERSLSALIQIDSGSGVRLYTESMKKWDTPVKGRELTESEYLLVIKRISNYMSLEGDVTLDDSPPMTMEDQLASMKASVEREGWTTETEGGQIRFVRNRSSRK